MWPDFFWPHQVRIRDRRGSGPRGPVHAPPRDVVAEVLDEQRLVRAQDGAEVVSSTQVTVPLTAEPSEGALFGALVTVWAGGSAERTAVVLAVSRSDNGGTPLDSHIVLHLE